MKIGQFETDALMDVAARPPLVFVEGRGSWIVDHRGKRYLDFVQGWAVNALGHCPPEIAQALARQSQRLVNPSPAYFNPDLSLGRAMMASRISSRFAHGRRAHSRAYGRGARARRCRKAAARARAGRDDPATGCDLHNEIPAEGAGRPNDKSGFNAPAAELAGKLARLSGLERVFLASSGAEANEGAIKLARKWGELNRGGAYEIVTFEGAFHGRTLATMAASGKVGWERLFEPKVPGFPKARFEDIASVVAVITDKTVGVMLEPVQGEAGVVPTSPAFLRAVRELCDRRRLLLILDEVQTGVGRTGTMFAFERAGVRPDVMTLGKGLGGGVPLAALLASGRASCFAHGDQGGTYCGNPLTAAVGNAVIDVVSQPDFLAEVTAKGDYLAQRLRELSARRGLAGERGSGLLRALDLGRPVAAQVVDAARALEPEGLLLNAPRPSLLRFMPALNVAREEIDRMVAQLDGVLESLA